MHSTVYNVEGVEAIYLKFVFNFNTSTCTVQCMMSKVSKQVIIYSIYLIYIYNDAKDKHRRMLTGTCIFSVLLKVLKVLCTEYYVFNHTDTCCLMSEASKVHCMECKRMNGTMSEVLKEIKY